MTIIVDSREQRPFDFLSCAGGVQTMKGTLLLGDYSVRGFEDRIAVERKSLPDLVQCLGNERSRFEREIRRAAGLDSFMVCIEASFDDLASGRYRSKLNPGAAVASVLAFMARHNVAFLFAGNRTDAEKATACFLRQYLRGKQHELEAVEAALRPNSGGVKLAYEQSNSVPEGRREHI